MITSKTLSKGGYAMRLQEDFSVQALHGVGKVRAAALEAMGIFTIRDLLWHFPRTYEDRGRIRTLQEGADGEKSAFFLTVETQPHTAKLKGRISLTKFTAFDDSGTVEVVFFNQPYLQTVFHVGDTYRFWGKLSYLKRWTLSSPAYEPVNHVPLRDLIPVYPLSENIHNKQLVSMIASALQISLSDPIPEEIRLAHKLPTRQWAIQELHNPSSQEFLEAATRRMIFDELFCLSLSINYRRFSHREPCMIPCKPCSLTPLLSQLPYQLTDGQKKVVNDLYRDMVSQGGDAIPAMRRIIVGDVGCGKTICAVIAMYITANSGFSSAMMVPTEILAHQHYHSIAPLLQPLGIDVLLITGSTPQKEKAAIRTRTADETSPPCVVIGTHALLNNNLQFASLGLTITDEQHRFGIHQRNTLQNKTQHSHLLVMSATPIPRTLALSLWGDLDISQIEHLPQGRQPIETFVVNEGYRNRLNTFIRKQVDEGGQVYIVCPSIEETETSPYAGALLWRSESMPPLKHATEYAENLMQNIFPDLNIALLHGKMKPAEKDAVMLRFARGEIRILVSTTVIEVGVNVPNACLMIIENAERFGMAQLHQLRGRVGRGSRKSYCILVSDSKSEVAKKRLETLRTTTDGYKIAEQDLALRGPGDFFGSTFSRDVRQSGGMQLRMANRCDDISLMTDAFGAAADWIRQDPTLSSKTSQPLKKEMMYLWNSKN